MDNLNQEKQASKDLKALLDKHKVGDAPVSTTLREMGKHYRLAETQGKRDAVKGIMRLIVKHRFLNNLDTATLKSLLEEAAGLKVK